MKIYEGIVSVDGIWSIYKHRYIFHRVSRSGLNLLIKHTSLALLMNTGLFIVMNLA